MKTMRLNVLILLASAVVQGAVGGRTCAAEDPTEALLRQGAELRKQERHQEALDLFRKAHALSPSGKTFAQMGLAEFSLKTYVDAETHLAAALASDSPWVAKNRSVLEQALTDVRKHVAIVTVVGPAGTDVAVNGRPVGRLPLSEPLHVAEGQVRIEGTAPDHQPATLDVTLAGGKDFKVTLDLVPVPAAPPPAALAPASAPVLVGGTTADTSHRWRRWVGGGLLAVSAAALTTGIVWVAVDGNAAPCDIPSTAPAGSRCGGRVYDTKSVGWIAIGTGVAAGVAGGIVLWTGRERDVQVGLGPGTLMAFGRF